MCLRPGYGRDSSYCRGFRQAAKVFPISVNPLVDTGPANLGEFHSQRVEVHAVEAAPGDEAAEQLGVLDGHRRIVS